MANETGVIMKLRKEAVALNASLDVLIAEYKQQEEKIKKLEFMVTNGLGWEDLKGGNIEDVS